MGDSFAPPVKAADDRVKVTPVDRSLKYSKDKHEENGVGTGYILRRRPMSGGGQVADIRLQSGMALRVHSASTRRMFMLKRTGWLVVAALAMFAWVGDAGAATLTVFKTFTGNNLVSTDGCGTLGESCTLISNIQAGSTIQAAYLYSSTHSLRLPFPDPNGITLSQGAATVAPLFIPLGINTDLLQAWRADVTDFVKTNANLGSLTTWTVTEGAKSAVLDGEALVIVYSNPTAQPSTHTITILDGFSASIGDLANIAFTALPVGFTANMFLGDGFSFDGPDPKAPNEDSQVSRITVNGIDITTVAGHCDDAQDATCGDGNLFTMGGSNAGPKTDPFTLFPCNGLGCPGKVFEQMEKSNQ